MQEICRRVCCSMRIRNFDRFCNFSPDPLRQKTKTSIARSSVSSKSWKSAKTLPILTSGIDDEYHIYFPTYPRIKWKFRALMKLGSKFIEQPISVTIYVCVLPLGFWMSFPVFTNKGYKNQKNNLLTRFLNLFLSSRSDRHFITISDSSQSNQTPPKWICKCFKMSWIFFMFNLYSFCKIFFFFDDRGRDLRTRTDGSGGPWIPELG